jgi:hypothetical protein
VSKRIEMPGFIKPQLATLKTKAPKGDQLWDDLFAGGQLNVNRLKHAFCEPSLHHRHSEKLTGQKERGTNEGLGPPIWFGAQIAPTAQEALRRTWGCFAARISLAIL